MNVRYRSIPDKGAPGGYSVIPLLQVFLRNDINMRPFLALIDSGASMCIFPESMGAVLGIDVPSGRPHDFYGLAKQVSTGFIHPVHLQVNGIPSWVEIEVGFIGGEIIPLLGQAGFFENFQVVFERFKRQFEVNTKMDALVRNRRGYGRGR